MLAKGVLERRGGWGRASAEELELLRLTRGDAHDSLEEVRAALDDTSPPAPDARRPLASNLRGSACIAMLPE